MLVKGILCPGRGQTCQSCHMPDRAHLFHGIHDPDMVRLGLAINTRGMEEARLILIRYHVRYNHLGPFAAG
ncbi:MAG: hypothetical protein ABW080_04625 [Candidatus Thiodiazotropha sp.]